MIVSHNPHEDRSIKRYAAFMVVLTVVLTGLRACQVARSDLNPFAAFMAKARLVLEQRDEAR